MFEIILPKHKLHELRDYRVSWLLPRKVFLRVKGRFEPEFLVKPVYETENFVLYSTNWASLLLLYEALQKGKVKIVSKKRTKPKPPKPPTLKQKLLLLRLSEELGVKVPYPETRKEASELIAKLLAVKKKRKVAVSA